MMQSHVFIVGMFLLGNLSGAQSSHERVAQQRGICACSQSNCAECNERTNHLLILPHIMGESRRRSQVNRVSTRRPARPQGTNRVIMPEWMRELANQASHVQFGAFRLNAPASSSVLGTYCSLRHGSRTCMRQH